MGLFLPKLDKTMKIVNPDGTPSPRFIIFWMFQSVRLDGVATLGNLPEVAAPDYDPVQFQAVLDFCNGLKRGLAG